MADRITAADRHQATDKPALEDRDAAAPDRPTELPHSAVPGVFKRTLKEFEADNLTDLAAALTYYSVLAIFPMIIVIVSILGSSGNLRPSR